MAEDHGFQPQEGHRLCVNNCGFFGSPATQNMCSKCYRDLHPADPQVFSKPAAAAAAAAAAEVAAPSSAEEPISAEISSTEKEVAAPRGTGRCSACRRRVGLTGFGCRCGATFCGVHRYPEKHGCSFDFKAAGREAIARANPVIKADKLERI
ncbi:Zinc finger A20 and AN1 domain-containing stress-associated protein 4 [Striga hermonthica]|uniref:Zinc finger A20 and AN1 domain-containing stress-associated protein 4 n=1 Tax=Striga hermonthica TaxID=68872 RepID=A0A9N7NWQ0_STRHE|nr:Zinc finger A20 and AN1 domain-containing stress-associated protein 4 [Striga hermonthica]